MTCFISYCLYDTLKYPWNVCTYVRRYVCSNISSDDTKYVQHFRSADIAFSTPVALT